MNNIRVPYYFGGMILSDINQAYDYEIWLSRMLKSRFDKYRKNWGFLLGMETLLKTRTYTLSDFHTIPEDPLINISEDALYWRCLRLKSRKLNILKLEVLKYYRRRKRYPV